MIARGVVIAAILGVVCTVASSADEFLDAYQGDDQRRGIEITHDGLIYPWLVAADTLHLAAGTYALFAEEIREQVDFDKISRR